MPYTNAKGIDSLDICHIESSNTKRQWNQTYAQGKMHTRAHAYQQYSVGSNAHTSHITACSTDVAGLALYQIWT